MTTDPMEQPEIQPEPGGTSQAQLPRLSLLARAGQLFKLALPILCLFQASLLIGWFLLTGLPESNPEGEDSHSGSSVKVPAGPLPVPGKEEAPDESELRDPRLGDSHLREENYQLALNHYLPRPGEAQTPLPDHLQFRVGLCLEGLGKWTDALATYREVVARASHPRVAAAAHVAQARIWVRKGQIQEAKAFLYPLLLQSGAADQLGAGLIAEAHYLLALALAREAFSDQQLVLANERLVRPDDAHWPLAHSIAWTGPDNLQKTQAKLPSGFELSPAVSEAKEEMLVRGAAHHLAIADLTDKLVSLAQLRIEWSTSAWQLVQGRTADVAVDGLPVIEVIRALTAPLGVLATCKDGCIQLVKEGDLPEKDLAAFRTAAARRALKDAVLANPNHPLASAAGLELGNDDAVNGRLQEAAGWYERLLRPKGRSGLVAGASFNLGLVQSSLKNYDAARKALYQVVDRDPGHLLAPRAYVQIGRTFLMESRPAEAITPLRRALAQSTGTGVQPSAAVELAAAHLLSGGTVEANKVLLANREPINTSAHRSTAAFLDALARFRVAAERKQSRAEAADLLAALVGISEQAPLGCVGQLLRGQAYRELGLGDQMAKIYQQSISRCEGPLADEMTFYLADYLVGIEKQRPEGIAMLQTLARKAVNKWSVGARLRLAALALEDSRPQDCLKQCQSFLPQCPVAEQPALLQIMGRAHESLGDFEQAARCYAGQMPK